MVFYLPEPLDSLFSIEDGAITNFFGAAGTGKTNICLILAVGCAKKGGKVAYIDTEGGFSPERARQVSGGKAEIDNILNNIVLIEPKNFEDQGKAVRNLEKQKIDFIVLDSSVALYRLEHPENNKADISLSEHSRELSRQLSILSSIAREKKIPAVITSHTYKNWDTGENEIVGGESLKYWSKAIVFLEKTGKISERKATITRHRSQPEGKSVKFIIVEDGVRPAGFKIF